MTADVRNLSFRPPSAIARATGTIPVRFEGAPGGPFRGDGRWRGVPNFEHATLCRIFQLDPCRFYFDLPSSVRGVGANRVGAGSCRSARRINGFVFMAGSDVPVAKLSVCLEDERFRDDDPTNARDFFDLDHS